MTAATPRHFLCLSVSARVGSRILIVCAVSLVCVVRRSHSIGRLSHKVASYSFLGTLRGRRDTSLILSPDFHLCCTSGTVRFSAQRPNNEVLWPRHPPVGTAEPSVAYATSTHTSSANPLGGFHSCSFVILTSHPLHSAPPLSTT